MKVTASTSTNTLKWPYQSAAGTDWSHTLSHLFHPQQVHTRFIGKPKISLLWGSQGRELQFSHSWLNLNFISIVDFIVMRFYNLENIFYWLQETSGYRSLPKLFCLIVILFFPGEKAYLTEATHRPSLYFEKACPEFITENHALFKTSVFTVMNIHDGTTRLEEEWDYKTH